VCGGRIIPAPAAVASGEDGEEDDNLKDGMADDGPADKEDIEVWEDDDEDAEDVVSDESGQTADDEPDVGKGAWMEDFLHNFYKQSNWVGAKSRLRRI